MSTQTTAAPARPGRARRRRTVSLAIQAAVFVLAIVVLGGMGTLFGPKTSTELAVWEHPDSFLKYAG